MKVGKYEVHETLGDGAFGKVKRAVNSETGESVAIKFLDKEKIKQQNMSKQIQREITIMRKVKHRHVVNLIEVLASNSKIFIVMESVTGGDLFDKIVSAGHFDEPTARRYFTQLMLGIQYCHENGVCHRDLKPENLLLTETGQLKISDFGLSAEFTETIAENGAESGVNLLRTTCGTSNYIAPEVLADAGYDGFLADIWSCGILLFVMLAGYLPFDDKTTARLFKKIMEEEVSYPKSFSAGARALLAGILQKKPEARLTLAQILADDWCQSKVVDDFSHVANAFELFNATNPYLSSAPSSAPSSERALA